MSDDLSRALRSTGPVEELVQGLRNYAYEQIGYLQINEKCLDAADLIEAQAARIAELEAVIDPVVLQAAKPFPVEEAIRKVVEGSLLTDQQKIEVYLAYKFRWIKAFFAGGRQKGMEEAALRLEELHKNHKYNPQNGEGSEHDTGYYRAISEGAAHIRAAAEEGE